MGLFLFLVSLFSAVGFMLTLLGFWGWLPSFFLYLLFSVFLVVPVSILYRLFLFIPQLSKNERVFLFVILTIWFGHFIQVLVPETGFDALWYHLPVVEHILSIGKITYLPELYQTMNPLFADMYFLVGYFVAGSVGAKLVAYLFGMMLAATTYFVARFFLRRDLSLLVVATVSLFQVVAWQSSSFYVDVAKAFFELAGLLAILNVSKKSTRFLLLAALLFSASLATKMFSLFLVPLFLGILWSSWKERKLKVSFFVVLVVVLFVCALPYYLGAWRYTGNPVFSLVVPLAILGEIAGSGSVVGYVLRRIKLSPLLFVTLLFARDYVPPLTLLAVIPIAKRFKDISRDYTLKLLGVFSFYQLGIWWFVPPFSTRYALSGFITLFLLGVIVVDRYFVHTKRQRFVFMVMLCLQIAVLSIPRVIVAGRSLTYLLTAQTQREYLQQFYDGTIDDKINDWYYPKK